MILEISQFLKSVDCRALCDGFDNLADKATMRDVTGHAVVDWRLIASSPRLAMACRGIVARVTQALQPFGTVFPETVILTAMGPGGLHPLHADNTRRDDAGNWVPNHTPDRVVSTIVYLNDRFDGGEIVFPEQQKAIKPSEGLLVAFPSGSAFPHEVLKVNEGLRYTMPIWFTREPTHSALYE